MYVQAYSIAGCDITSLVPLVITCESSATTTDTYNAPSVDSIVDLGDYGSSVNEEEAAKFKELEDTVLGFGSATTTGVSPKDKEVLDDIFGASAFEADVASTHNKETKIKKKPKCLSVKFSGFWRLGMRGEEVRTLQKFLNQNNVTNIKEGAGSKGKETDYFGAKTYNAIIRFQNMFKKDILTPVGLTSATGYWGPSTVKKANAITALCTQ